jgi:AcrR family transcriptional regulator
VSIEEPTPAFSLPRRDGRRQRSERTRQAFIEAYLQLLKAEPKMPTAQQIAEQAGYSVRSIFERFSDLDALTIATADYAIARGQALAVARDLDGARPARIRSHVATRALACEQWLPLWRILVIQTHPELRHRVRMVRLANIERLELMYRPELALLGEPERGKLLLTLATLTSFEGWDQLRHCHELSIEAAQAVWRAGVDRLLPP